MSNKKGSSSGCFSSIFRWLLCSRSPQTHPSDHITEVKHVDDVAKVQVQASETCPGIVARLMGLDSLPEHKAPGPVTRSRSVSFVDYTPDFNSTHAGHRRVKTSTSFREVLLVPQGPRLLQQNQNHELLVVCMDKNKEIEFESSSKQKENVKKEHQEKNKKISKLKNEPRRVSRTNSRAKTPLKEVSVESKKKKRKQCEVKKAEYSENSSEGSSSSPLSVLNVNDFAAYQKNGFSEDSKSLELKFEKSFESKYEEETVYYMELLDNPCKLTEKDMNFSNWITKEVFMFEEFEDKCMEFEEQILDLMLHQVADELVVFHICNA